MNLLIISVVAAITYCWRYYDYSGPPKRDFISSVVLLSIGFDIILTIPPTFSMVLGLISLLLDIIADFYMDAYDKDRLMISLLLFSWGHFIRQCAFVWSLYPHCSLILLLLSSVLIGLHYYFPRWRIITYILIITITVINISTGMSDSIRLFKGSLSFGLTLFVISDLIIAYELYWNTLKIRQIRVLAVPVLFWLAEFVILCELLY